MDKGVFVISLDTEFIWGRINDPTLVNFIDDISKTRNVILKLIDLFEKYEIPVTWAVVGAMIDNNNRMANINEIYPNLTKELLEEKYNSNQKNSLIYANDILQSILNSSIKHEIASHSYFHLEYGKASEKQVILDLSYMTDALNNEKLNTYTHIFSRNNIGHKNLLEKFGIQYYRGKDIFFFENYPKYLKKILYQLDMLLGWTPSVSEPIKDGDLINIPGSMIFRIPKYGVQKFISAKTLEKKAMKGIKNAILKKQIFHLWFHPFNFAHKENEHFNALENILKYVSNQQKQNQIQILTMHSIGKKLK